MDDLLSEIASTCLHLTEVRIKMNSMHSNGLEWCITDMGLIALAHLLKLKRFEVGGSADITQSGILARARNVSVNAVHARNCARLKWPHAQSVMSMVTRPYLDNIVHIKHIHIQFDTCTCQRLRRHG